jgi:hypothetical protein
VPLWPQECCKNQKKFTIIFFFSHLFFFKLEQNK